MTWDQRFGIAAQAVPAPSLDSDMSDTALLQVALRCAGLRRPAPAIRRLLAEFGDVALILASDTDELCARGGLSLRAAATLKLLGAIRRDHGERPLLH